MNGQEEKSRQRRVMGFDEEGHENSNLIYG